jgi:hypothetical protein
MKALILATGYLRLDGIHIRCVPEFAEVTIEDKVRTAIKLVVEPGQPPNSSENSSVTTEERARAVTNLIVEPEQPPDIFQGS